MSEADIFGKLSRIFETHAFSNDDHGDDDLDDILDDFRQFETQRYGSNSPNKSQYSPNKSKPLPTMSPNGRPTPYEVWEKKNEKNNFSPRKTPKLSGEQWDRLVDKMYQSNRAKQSAVVKEQNEGLALELGGFLFKPRINKSNSAYYSKMRPLLERMPEMLTEKNKFLEAKQRESLEETMKECTFEPTRKGKATSEKYLHRMGRKKTTPKDFFQYEQERLRRIDMRKQIMEEIENKELTFRPTLGQKSIKLQERLLSKGAIERDPLTKTTITPSTIPIPEEIGSEVQYQEGDPLILESEHPYRHNTHEYSTISLPGAISYMISFDESTKTEAVYDYLKFFQDETHTQYFGCGKYSGGANGSAFNWPGIGNRPPLLIPASKFVVHFKTNGTINDWGFKMIITPLIIASKISNNSDGKPVPFMENASIHTPSVPYISEAGRNYKPVVDQVHNRLYKHAIEKQVETHNQIVELMQNKLNVTLKPWELPRGADGNQSFSHSFHKQNQKSHLPKAPLSDFIEELIIQDTSRLDLSMDEDELNENDDNEGVDGPTTSRLSRRKTSNKSAITIVEFDDSLAPLWRQLRTI